MSASIPTCSVGSCQRHGRCMYLNHPRCPERLASQQPPTVGEDVVAKRIDDAWCIIFDQISKVHRTDNEHGRRLDDALSTLVSYARAALSASQGYLPEGLEELREMNSRYVEASEKWRSSRSTTDYDTLRDARERFDDHAGRFVRKLLSASPNKT